MKHNPNCAIVRLGDIRAWCDCGSDIADRIASLSHRQSVCWDMAEVFLSSKDAHGLHDMGVEIQGIQWAIRELEALNKNQLRA